MEFNANKSPMTPLLQLKDAAICGNYELKPTIRQSEEKGHSLAGTSAQSASQMQIHCLHCCDYEITIMCLTQRFLANGISP